MISTVFYESLCVYFFVIILFYCSRVIILRAYIRDILFSNRYLRDFMRASSDCACWNVWKRQNEFKLLFLHAVFAFYWSFELITRHIRAIFKEKKLTWLDTKNFSLLGKKGRNILGRKQNSTLSKHLYLKHKHLWNVRNFVQEKSK